MKITKLLQAWLMDGGALVLLAVTDSEQEP
jgi:hypothetical protein